MRIIVDAMGGDNAPQATLLGAMDAAKEYGVEVILVGRGEEILQTLKDQGIDTLPKGVEIANAEEVVDMHDDPASVIRKKKNSSMVIGLQMLRDGAGDAFVSAGSTGALLSAATLIVKRVKGIRRAAMGPMIPTKTGGSAVLIDCGATADATPEFLLQFAFMGSYYAKKMLGLSNPRVGLLNIGAEDSKGGELQKTVYPLLQKAGEAGYINFIGNVEARDVPLGGADVVVSDGFSGNVLLKGIEGTAMFMASMMKGMFKKNLLTKLAALACKSGINDFKKKMDSRETGGTLLLGLTKPVIKAHGSSDAYAIKNAIRQAKAAAEADIAGDITANIDKMMVPKELEHAE
ncbi:MAG: phosphate acyltransferase PlsX [Clostridia bacterium]|nr:phosphate acyltransferase PlsX [Clostridia bacterium]